MRKFIKYLPPKIGQKIASTPCKQSINKKYMSSLKYTGCVKFLNNFQEQQSKMKKINSKISTNTDI